MLCHMDNTTLNYHAHTYVQRSRKPLRQMASVGDSTMVTAAGSENSLMPVACIANEYIVWISIPNPWELHLLQDYNNKITPGLSMLKVTKWHRRWLWTSHGTTLAQDCLLQLTRSIPGSLSWNVVLPTNPLCLVVVIFHFQHLHKAHEA